MLFSSVTLQTDLTAKVKSIKFIVRQIHRKKEKTQTQSSIKIVYPNKEFLARKHRKTGKFTSRAASHIAHTWKIQ